MTYPESAAVAGGDQATAAQYNNLRYDALNQFIMPGGRLTGESGVPVSQYTGNISTLYYTPFHHNRIPLYDGTRWAVKEFAELSLYLTGISPLGDIFVYDNAGTLTLEGAAAGAKTTLTADVSPGSSVVCAVASTTGAVVGDPVFIDSAIPEVCIITAVNPGVSITVDEISFSKVSGNTVVFYPRVTALGSQDGRYVKSGDATRLYLGTVGYLPPLTTVVRDTVQYRGIWNMYNRVFRPFYYSNTDSHTYNSTTVRKWGEGTVSQDVKQSFVVGVDDQPIRAEYRGMVKAAAAGNRPQIGLGLDSVSAFDTKIELAEIQTASLMTLTGGAWVHAGRAGLHELYALEAAASGGGTFSNISIKGGIFA